MAEFRPFDQDTHPEYNAQPGIVITPGTRYANEMMKFEQFPGKYGNNPGNPYVKREYPKMLYRARRLNGGGAPVSIAAQPNPNQFASTDEATRMAELVRVFNEENTLTVENESQRQRAMENGWRESPGEAVEAFHAKEKAISNSAAERNYDDRNLGELAKREADAASKAAAAEGKHLPEVPEQPRAKRKYTRRAKPEA